MSSENLRDGDLSGADGGLVNPELVGVDVAEESGDLSRGAMILKGALAVGAVYGTVMAGPFVRQALAMNGGGDVDILNFALTLEYLEAGFYAEAKKRAGVKGELKKLVGLLASDEKQHVEALTATVKKLGGKPVKEPKFDFEYSDTAGFLKLARTFEDTGVGADSGAPPLLKYQEIVAPARAIVQGEGRPPAAIRLQDGEEPAPEAFDPSLKEAQVLKAVEPFLT
jgi:hypothetical protein